MLPTLANRDLAIKPGGGEALTGLGRALAAIVRLGLSVEMAVRAGIEFVLEHLPALLTAAGVQIAINFIR